MKNSILNWYNFKENSNILNLENIQILDSTEIKYDYVIFYDLKLISRVMQILKEDGIALLLVDNKLSISHFAGSKPLHGNVYDTITKDDNQTFSKKSIEKELIKRNLNYNFYYAFPNLEKPNVIFSDKYLPSQNTSKLMYNVSYLPGSAVVFDELSALKQVTKEGYFQEFANSYIIEIGNIKNEQPIFVGYNNLRKKEYQLITLIYNESVKKIPNSEEAVIHINKIWENTENLRNYGFEILEQKRENSISSEFIKSETLDKIISKLIIDNNLDEAFEKIMYWYNYIKEKLPSNEENGLNITQQGYIDLVFENSFLIENKIVFFDQEWFMENIPIEFILYRAIKNLYAYSREIDYIYSYEKMLKRFNLFNYVDMFEKIEKEFQEKIIDENKINESKKSLEMLVDINELALLNDYKNNNKKQNEYIETIKDDNEKKQKYIENLEKIIEEDRNFINSLENTIKEKNQYIETLEKNQRWFFRRK